LSNSGNAGGPICGREACGNASRPFQKSECELESIAAVQSLVDRAW
jgi:hypothetical protein